MPLTLKVFTCLVALSVATVCFAQAPNSPAASGGIQQATHLLGLEAIKRDVKGSLAIGSDGLKFSSAAGDAQIATASIEDVFTGQDSRQTGGKAMTVTKLAVPYGGGRVLSLFAHEKFDSLTVEYRDRVGALHAAIFRLRLGQAATAKKQLIAMGAKASTAVEETPASKTKDAANKEKQ